jgi:hypothetical protein
MDRAAISAALVRLRALRRCCDGRSVVVRRQACQTAPPGWLSVRFFASSSVARHASIPGVRVFGGDPVAEDEPWSTASGPEQQTARHLKCSDRARAGERDRMAPAYRGRRRRGSRRPDNLKGSRTVRGGAANGATVLNLSYLCLAKWVPYLEGPVEQRARQASEATRPPCSHPLIAIGSPF